MTPGNPMTTATPTVEDIRRVIREGDEARKDCTTSTGLDYDNIIRPALLAALSSASGGVTREDVFHLLHGFSYDSFSGKRIIPSEALVPLRDAILALFRPTPEAAGVATRADTNAPPVLKETV